MQGFAVWGLVFRPVFRSALAAVVVLTASSLVDAGQGFRV